jgi:membrane protease YdiL (CAAX protease family)
VVELTPLPLVYVANAAAGRRWANQAAEIAGGIAGGLFCLLGVADLAGAQIFVPAPNRSMQQLLDLTIMATGLAVATVSSRQVRASLARVIPIDPASPVHALALILAVMMFGVDVGVVAFTDVLGANARSSPLSIADLVFTELPFFVFAFAGVGLFVRRDVSESARRLGVVVPRWWQIVVAVAVAGAFVAIVAGTDALDHALIPSVASRVDEASNHLFGALANPYGIAALAFVPAICEDLLFRGALQPRLGLVATAVLFTSIHTEYGLSFDTLGIFVLALGLGAVRRYSNTTTSIACHAVYNLLVGIGVTATPATAAVEVVLVAAAGYIVWSQRRRPSAAAHTP